MKELQSICTALAQLQDLQSDAVLATVVAVAGSTYRRPGARMLVTPAGQRIGSVSGGCLESDVSLKARQLTEGAPAALLTYDSRSDDAPWSLGLGCNGRIDVLVQRLRPHEPHPLPLVAAAFAQRRPAILATLYETSSSLPLGAQILFDDQLNIVFDPHHLAKSFPQLNQDARRALEVSANTNVEYPNPAARLLIEILQPPPRLIVCGAGIDARPLVDAAHTLGWHVTVADRRARFATADHFPTADEILVCAPEQLVERTRPDPRTAAVVMHHNYDDDLAALRALLPSPARYVGQLGPRQRHDQLLADLRAAGYEPTADEIAKLHGPVGLNLGAETPDEIAVAVVAEILATANHRRGGHLRDQSQPIHDPIDAPAAATPHIAPPPHASSLQCQAVSR
jgi:xanthine/CO dehydrogenase XdhC/CoxF family maturation factor